MGDQHRGDASRDLRRREIGREIVLSRDRRKGGVNDAATLCGVSRFRLTYRRGDV